MRLRYFWSVLLFNALICAQICRDLANAFFVYTKLLLMIPLILSFFLRYVLNLGSLRSIFNNFWMDILNSFWLLNLLNSLELFGILSFLSTLNIPHLLRIWLMFHILYIISFNLRWDFLIFQSFFLMFLIFHLSTQFFQSFFFPLLEHFSFGHRK